MSLQFPIALVLSIVCLAVPSVVGAEVQTLTDTHTYIMGNNDSRNDARQFGCVLQRSLGWLCGLCPSALLRGRPCLPLCNPRRYVWEPCVEWIL
jgi:hypothetical protein